MRRIPAIGILTGLLLFTALPIASRAQTGLSLPAGFHASVYAQGLSNPTAIRLGPDGRLYVAEEGGAILAIGASRQVIASVSGVPLGLAWHSHRLYVSSTGQISVLTPSNGYRSFSRKVIVSGLPTGRHQNDAIAFHGGWMYVGVGSTCNACSEPDARSATIMRFRPNGTGGQIFARGLRNPYGLAFRPGTGDLYATDNGRDDFGDSVPDELNRIMQGGRYGWPNCWGNGGGSGCGGTRTPVALFAAHSSADGLAFYTGKTFPQAYRGDAFVAEYGDTVNNAGTGHVVMRVHFSGSRATVSTFVRGMSNPLAVTNGHSGSLLIADWGTGIIWRIQSTGH